MGRIYLMKPSI